MKISRVILLVCMFMLNAVVQANDFSVRSSNIPLANGAINPRETFLIATDKLIPGASYRLVCKITDTNNKNNQAILNINIIPSSVFDMTTPETILNGVVIPGGNKTQLKLTQIDNILELHGILKDNQVNVTNLDQTDSVTISCAATAQTSN